jgi:hypothetical protein
MLRRRVALLLEPGSRVRQISSAAAEELRESKKAMRAISERLAPPQVACESTNAHASD